MKKSNPIKLIVGLGNPGTAYAHTYHNAGQIGIAALRDFFGEGTAPKKTKLFTYARCGGIPLVTPTTFMNESGSAVRAALHFFKAKPEELLVIHDDSDLPFGDVRTAFERGSAGHHGVDSVIRSLGTKAFWRLRIGVRRPRAERPRPEIAAAPSGERLHSDASSAAISGRGRQKAQAFVLKKMSGADEHRLHLAVTGAIEKLITNDLLPPSGLISENGKLTPLKR